MPRSSQYDMIRIVGLSAHGRHGVYPTERENGQPFRVDVTMYVDTRRAADADELVHTVDYSKVAQTVAEILSGPPVNLIETLAQKVADAVLAFPGVEIAEVEVHKPYAPLECEFSDVTMTIRRERKDVKNSAKTVAGAKAEKAADPRLGQPAFQKPAPKPPRKAKQRVTAAGGSAVRSAEATASGGSVVRSAEATAATGSATQLKPAARTRSRTKQQSTLRNIAVLALGANLGNPALTMAKAIQELDSSSEINVRAVSGLFISAPLLAEGQAPQPDYYNAVIEVETELTAHELLAAIQYVENLNGRERKERWGSRTLDIDLINFNQDRVVEDHLILPHPRAHKRAFVLQPWLQIDPEAKLLGTSVSDLAVLVEDQDLACVATSWVIEALEGEDFRISDSESAATTTEAPVEQAPPKKRPAAKPAQAPAATPLARPAPAPKAPAATPAAKTQAKPAQAPAPSAPKVSPTPAAAPAAPAPKTPASAPAWKRAVQPAIPRIIDDAEDNIFANPAKTTQANNAGNPARGSQNPNRGENNQETPRPRLKPVMKVDLPDDTPVGLLPVGEHDETVVRRDQVMRPTATGAIPAVRKRSEHQGKR
ncbi:MAG: 2-amino-4-hydroxy-6-hydroxymethyldihydropteridine diphosphokinase [Actinomycetaceae bacterium]|nr:2-amino-4-hydroxy-6-hydroxymethyldihydropteridine diphosphokinase [Actinomycetaceae bacterium]